VLISRSFDILILFILMNYIFLSILINDILTNYTSFVDYYAIL